MTKDNIETRNYYRQLYQTWPTRIISIHLDVIEDNVANMSFDDMREARELMDEKIGIWK
jgi:hypothetical protein